MIKLQNLYDMLIIMLNLQLVLLLVVLVIGVGLGVRVAVAGVVGIVTQRCTVNCCISNTIV